MITFGPVPSRRLGRSLGINNIPSVKKCPYSCIYCQVGITRNLSLTREKFYDPETIFLETKSHLSKLEEKDWPDYLTFVANGEPTLDQNLGEAILRLKKLNIPVAVITNGALLWQQQVREDLSHADWVSVKVDSAEERVWKEINRPIWSLEFELYREGLLQFSKEYKGKLVTETMLVHEVNDKPEILQQTAVLVVLLKPSMAYLSIPTRPPALKSVKAPDEERISEAYHIYSAQKLQTELLIGFEGANIGFTGNALEDILNTCAVHPIRKDAMAQLLEKDHADPYLLESLISGGYIKQIQYKSETFYIRRFHI